MNSLFPKPQLFLAYMYAIMLLFATPQLAKSQTPTDLFMSEYIEGSSNNKAIEIFNGTGAAINLATGQYVLQIYANGGTAPTSTITLTGTVANNDVFVIANTAAVAAILNQADQQSGSVSFNGDDAVVLRKGGSTGTILDVIGQIGNDPGTEWGSGLTSTADNTLRRKINICGGDSDGANAFDPTTQWDGFATDAFDGLGTHTVSCGPVVDVPPTVASTSPTNNAVNVAIGTGITITFGEAVDVATDAFSILPSFAFTTTPTLPAANVTSVTLTPTASLSNSTTYTVTTEATTITDRDGTISPMVANHTFSFTTIAPPGVCGVTNLISAIQGTGSTAAITGSQTIQGIVVGDFQNVGSVVNLGGFYVQEEDVDSDGNANTSEGIFVYEGTSSFLTNVAVGDRVCITGTVSEFVSLTSSLTQITVSSSSNIVVASSGNQSLATAAAVQLPVNNVADLERFEGMAVSLSAATGNLMVTETFQLGRFGQVLLAANGPSNQPGTDARLDQFTQFNAPSATGYSAYLAEIAKRRIYMDDGRFVQNPDPIILGRGGNPLSAANTLRGGDELTVAVGILDHRAEGYRIQPTVAPNFLPTNARPTTPPSVGAATLKVASFNVLNYFNGPAFPTPRGADNTTEFTRQRDKIIQAIIGTGADILGLMELEDDDLSPANVANSAVQNLVNGLNAVAGAGTYAFVNPGDISEDAITVGIIYKPAVVELVGAAAAIPFTFGSGSFDVVNRRALAQTIKQKSDNETFTLVVNHFKSKGSSSGGPGDADAGDGQGLSNGIRTRQATDLKDWLATKPTATNDPDYVVLGDLNAYANEDPLTTLAAAGYANLLPNTSYSYVFDGQLGSLDHILGTATLAAQMTGATKWHINADEPTVLDYNTEFKTAGQVVSLYAPNPFRSSDHDAIIVGLNLSACAATLNYVSPTDDVSTNATTRKAAQTITATNKILSSGSIIYQAGQAVVLSAGFSAAAGSVFTAQIGGCN